jgi:hypothetical protein
MALKRSDGSPCDAVYLTFFILYLVQPASEIDDYFPSSVVVDDLKLTNVTWDNKGGRKSKPSTNTQHCR